MIIPSDRWNARVDQCRTIGLFFVSVWLISWQLFWLARNKMIKIASWNALGSEQEDLSYNTVIYKKAAYCWLEVPPFELKLVSLT